MRHLGEAWAALFAAVVCAEDAPRKKPDPQAYELALEARAWEFPRTRRSRSRTLPRGWPAARGAQVRRRGSCAVTILPTPRLPAPSPSALARASARAGSVAGCSIRTADHAASIGPVASAAARASARGAAVAPIDRRAPRRASMTRLERLQVSAAGGPHGVGSFRRRRYRSAARLDTFRVPTDRTDHRLLADRPRGLRAAMLAGRLARRPQ